MLRLTRPMRRLLAAWLLLASGTAASASALVDEVVRIPIKGLMATYELETLLVREARREGPLPVALITHGGGAMNAVSGWEQNPPPQRVRRLHEVKGYSARGMEALARDFARRGWLAVVVVRRGYGTSQGRVATHSLCNAEAVGGWTGAMADDVLGVMEALAKRPEADAKRVVGVGVAQMARP